MKNTNKTKNDLSAFIETVGVKKRKLKTVITDVRKNDLSAFIKTTVAEHGKLDAVITELIKAADDGRFDEAIALLSKGVNTKAFIDTDAQQNLTSINS